VIGRLCLQPINLELFHEIEFPGRTEEALHVSEAEHRQMVEFHPQVPWIMDAMGNNLDVNSRWIQATGPNKERPRNLGWIKALHLDDADSTMKAVREAMVSCKPIDVQYRVRGVDGDVERNFLHLRTSLNRTGGFPFMHCCFGAQN
jgi:PAS domain-containing protein